MREVGIIQWRRRGGRGGRHGNGGGGGAMPKIRDLGVVRREGLSREEGDKGM